MVGLEPDITEVPVSGPETLLVCTEENWRRGLIRISVVEWKVRETFEAIK